MSGGMRGIQRWTLAAAVAASLGFGAAQAFASPSAAAVAGERACTQPECNRKCQAAGYDGGICASTQCICFIT